MKDSDVVRFNPGKMNPNILRPAGPIDPDVGILLFRTAADDRPLASLAVFALHLDTVGGLEYSADFPCYLEQSLRQELGEGFVSFFGNGTCGDINHIDVSHRRPQQGHEEARRIGLALTATVKGKLGDLKEVEKPSLDVRMEVVDVPLQQYDEKEIAWAKEAMKKVHTSQLPFLDRVKAYKIMALELIEGDRLPMTVQVFRIADEVAVVALPGEVFVDLGLAIKRASPFANTIVIELVNDAPGYLPTRKAFAEGSYETINSRIAPGGAAPTPACTPPRGSSPTAFAARPPPDDCSTGPTYATREAESAARPCPPGCARTGSAPRHAATPPRPGWPPAGRSAGRAPHD